jgi:hypothetical protein
MAIPLFQSASDAVQLLSIESVSVIGLLLAFLGYQIWQNQLLKKEILSKEDKIHAIITEYNKDRKDGTKDMIELINRYHTFVDQLQTLFNGRERGRN